MAEEYAAYEGTWTQEEMQQAQQQQSMMMNEAYMSQMQQAQMYAAMQGQQGQMMMMPYMQMPMYARMPLPSEMIEEQPTYVNAKQYRRIIKRRQARAKLEQRRKIPSSRKNYLHESRHAHACRRPRGPGGRFLTKEELEEYHKKVGSGLNERVVSLLIKNGQARNGLICVSQEAVAAVLSEGAASSLAVSLSGEPLPMNTGREELELQQPTTARALSPGRLFVDEDADPDFS